MRQRLTRRLTGSMRTRRRAIRRFAVFCTRVSARPRGFRVGMLISACVSVNARKPKSWSKRLSGGKGDGVASARRLSCVLPAYVSLRKRMVSAAWISRTFLTVWDFFLPRSQRVCSVGSWGRSMRRSVPSWPTGGRSVPALPPWPQLPRCAGQDPSRTGWGHPPARAASPAAPPTGHESTAGLCFGPCRRAAPAQPEAERSSGRPGETRADPRVSAGGSSCTWSTAGRCVAVHRGASGPDALGTRPQRVGFTAEPRLP